MVKWSYRYRKTTEERQLKKDNSTLKHFIAHCLWSQSKVKADLYKYVWNFFITTVGDIVTLQMHFLWFLLYWHKSILMSHCCKNVQRKYFRDQTRGFLCFHHAQIIEFAKNVFIFQDPFSFGNCTHFTAFFSATTLTSRAELSIAHLKQVVCLSPPKNWPMTWAIGSWSPMNGQDCKQRQKATHLTPYI